MWDTFSNLAFGLGIALTLKNVFFCFVGCLVGTLVGVLPGVGPGRDHRDPLARHPVARPDGRAHHARRHLLRRAVRRLDDRHPRQHSR